MTEHSLAQPPCATPVSRPIESLRSEAMIFVFSRKGFCRSGICASFPASNVGEACTFDGQCVGAETAYETPPFCAGPVGFQTCGAESASCYSETGGSSGSSPTCASGKSSKPSWKCLTNCVQFTFTLGICKSYACTALVPIAAGGSCTYDYQCAGDSTCREGTCNDYGVSCTADDGTSTGAATLCDAGMFQYVYPLLSGALTFDDRCERLLSFWKLRIIPCFQCRRSMYF